MALLFVCAPTAALAGSLTAGWLESAAENAAPARAAFFAVMGDRLVPAQGAGLSAASGAEAAAAERLMSASGPDIILAAGPATLRALARANNGATAVVALSPECTPELFADGKAPPNFLLFSPEFWDRRMRTLHAAARFARLGLIVPSESVPEKTRISAALARAAANKVGGRGAFESFVFEGLRAVDAESCRDAVDSLFFDEIDAVLLDGSGCFAPERADFKELMDLLRSRGILPLSLEDPALAEAGALLAPWGGEKARLGRELALFCLRSGPVATKLARADANGQSAGPDRKAPVLYTGTDRPLFTLNLTVAGEMGFDPPVALLALTRERVDPSGKGGPAAAGK